MAELLTARRVAAAKTSGTAITLNDTLITGLGLRVPPTGAKTWSVRYRMGRTLRRLTLGSYPVLDLASARLRAKEALKLVADGIDPAEQKSERRDADTVGDFAAVYIAQHAKPHKKSWKVDQMRLDKDVLPAWKHRLMAEITRRDVRELLDAIALRPAPIVANRVRSLLHKMFNVAIELEVVESNPVTASRRPGTEHQRDRVLTEEELRMLWHSFEALDPIMGAFYKLRLLTVQRGGEVAAMRWRDLELARGWWTIPATMSKNKLAHRVPLSPSALAIVQGLSQLENYPASGRAAYVLAGARGKRQQAEAAATFTVPDFRGHDLRRTAASMMASGGVSRLTISKILNHVERSVTAVYDRHSYDAEKAAALAWWDTRLRAIIERDEAKVLAFVK